MAFTDTTPSSTVSVHESARGIGGTTLRRIALFGVCLAAAGAGLLFEPDATNVRVEPNLTLLLNAMLAMKAGLALVGFGAVWWRLGLIASGTLAAGYIGAAALLALGSALLIKGGGFMTAGSIFHAGILMLLVLAWRDGFDGKSSPRSTLGL